jgi:DNA-binding CsgD family transcriptional regulator
VYHRASPSERRVAHAALAEKPSPEEFLGLRARHRALAADPPDEPAAHGLASVGSAARLRGAPAEAASAYELAARLTADPELRSERLAAAGESYAFAGQMQPASEALEEALQRTSSPERRTSVRVIQARLLIGSGSGLDAHALLTEEALGLSRDAPDRAALLHAEAGVAMMAAARPRDVLASGDIAYQLAEPLGGEALVAASITLASGLVLLGDTSRGEPMLMALLEALEAADPTVVWQPLQGVAAFLAVLDRDDESRQILARGVAAARSLSAPGLLPYPLGTLAHVDFRLGRWPMALAEASEAVELSHQTGLVGFAAWALSARARIKAGQGDVQEARDDGLAAIESALMLGGEITVLYARAALILAALSDGMPDEAIEHGEPLARLWKDRGYRQPGVANWHADLIEAYVHADRRDEAARLLETFADQAEATRGPWALATAARCRGLLTEDEAFEECFADSLRLHAKCPMPFERARTELCLGERRRRAGRRVDARVPLRAALSTFEELGARPWADRARAELRACGETRARPEPGPLEELTPHELQVALVVARGATNREAAAELFLSPKTIDFHLRNVYRKLGLRSRAELARLLALEGPQRSRL